MVTRAIARFSEFQSVDAICMVKAYLRGLLHDKLHGICWGSTTNDSLRRQDRLNGLGAGGIIVESRHS